MAERVIARIVADQRAYLRAHLIMGAAATFGVGAVLIWMGNPHPWVALIAGPAAIAVRGFYLAAEALTAVWDLTDQSLTSPGGQVIALSQIERVRTLGSAVQVITQAGDKHLIKYLASPADTVELIERALP